MPRKPKSKSPGKRQDKSGLSDHSEDYRDRSGLYSDEGGSSQDSSPRSRKNDSQDEPDFVSRASSSYSETSYLDVSSDRGSPYSKLQEQLSDMRAQYDTNPSPAFKNMHISPDFRKRPGKPLDQFEQHSPERKIEQLERRPLHKSSSPYGSPRRFATNRPRDYTDSEGTQHGQGIITVINDHPYVCGTCVLIFLIMFFMFFIYPMFTTSPVKVKAANLSEKDVLLKNFDTEFKQFMGLFPAQGIRFWKILKAATKSVLRESEPRMPVVIIIVSNEGAHNSAMCITKRFSDVITKVYRAESPLQIHNQDILQYPEASQLKKYLDVTLQKAFVMSKVAVIHEIDKIPGEAAMIFHSYCDNEFAPYKDAAIIFTVKSQDDILADDSDVENYLEEKWEKELDKDKRGALIYSRIANNIAFVKPEDDSVIHSVCP